MRWTNWLLCPPRRSVVHKNDPAALGLELDLHFPQLGQLAPDRFVAFQGHIKHHEPALAGAEQLAADGAGLSSAVVPVVDDTAGDPRADAAFELPILMDDFAKRMETHFDRADIAEVNYSKAVYDAIVKTSLKTGKLTLTMDTEIKGLDIYYTTNDAMPDNFCAKYTQPVALPDEPVAVAPVAGSTVAVEPAVKH